MFVIWLLIVKNFNANKATEFKWKLFNDAIRIYSYFKFGTVEHVIAALVQSAVDTKTSLSNHNVTTVNRHAPNFLVASFARRLVSNSIEKNSEHLQEESLIFYYY